MPSVAGRRAPRWAWTTPASPRAAPALRVNASGFVSLDSPPFGTAQVPAVGSSMSLDVFVPDVQPNPGWLGDVQLFFSAPSAGLNNVSLGQSPLTGLPRGRFDTLVFSVPENVRTTLLGDHPGAHFTITVNTPAGAQPLLLDNLRFSGTLTGRQIYHARVLGGQTAINPLFGFELLTDWSATHSGLALSTTRVEGAAALAVPAAGYTLVRAPVRDGQQGHHLEARTGRVRPAESAESSVGRRRARVLHLSVGGALQRVPRAVESIERLSRRVQPCDVQPARRRRHRARDRARRLPRSRLP